MTEKGKVLIMNNSAVKPAPNPAKVVTGRKTRFSYCNLWEPKSINGGKPHYSASLIIPKSDTKTVEALYAAQRAAYENGKDKLKNKNGSVPPMEAIKLAIRDGDTDRPDDPAYAGCLFVNANSDRQPNLYDAAGQEILDRAEVYSGCYGKASITFFVFNTNGNRGIACGLNGLQKIRDGEPLGGRGNVLADFMNAADDDDEDDEEELLG